ncbi:MAG: beta-lactamase family protein [Deltaproteobacteria bacterium]|nr:beta-lactamase family protein [Deltaproteobacteria bacterium]
MAATSIDRVLDEAIASSTAPGIVALAADESGIFYQGARGRVAPGAAAPVALDSVFRIASMTKAITSAAAMKLVEQGKLGLEQPMAEIAPELAEVVILLGFDGDGDGTPRTRKPRRAITLRHLLTHTSGFSYDLFNKDVARYMEHEGLPSIATCMNRSLRAPLLFEPGERWEYGIGIDWAGKLVEAASGRKLERYLQDEFFHPLGMKDTSFVLRDDMSRRLVAATQRQPDGAIARIDFEFPQDADFHMGGGGLYSTGPDYLRFTRMLLGGGALDRVRVLAPETVKRMGENAIGDIAVPPLASDNPAMAIPYEFWPGQIKRWGLAYMLNTEDVAGGRAAGSCTWAGVHNTFFWIDPARRRTAVLMMQILPANDAKVIATLESFERAVYATSPR